MQTESALAAATDLRIDPRRTRAGYQPADLIVAPRDNPRGNGLRSLQQLSFAPPEDATVRAST
jgi:hypothetical protein